MRLLRLSLFVGGLFNVSMGVIFLSRHLLKGFFSTASTVEKNLFGSEMVLTFPSDPVHLLLIHGFGAGVLILGATLLYAVRNPRPLLSFVFIDGLGRLLFSGILFYYVWTFSLMKTILMFGALELALALAYIWSSWKMKNGKWKVESAK